MGTMGALEAVRALSGPRETHPDRPKGPRSYPGHYRYQYNFQVFSSTHSRPKAMAAACQAMSEAAEVIRER